MEQGTTYVALDDSARKIVAGILRPDTTQVELREMPNEPAHLRRLFERLKREGPVVACYEAGVLGYDLYRQLRALDVPCQVMAPALTPRRAGQRIKTDRRDAIKLVRLFRAGELTPIHVPTEVEEAGRDLLRCRDDVRRDVLRWRHRVLKLLARHGRVFRGGRHWTQRHWRWLRQQQFAVPPLQRTLEASLGTLEQALARLAELDHEILALAETDPYRTPVGWLRCFRGIATLSAMILVVEILDFHRFTRPRELMAYLGLVPTEYSSGDREWRGALTKAGNSHARRVLVEAAWHYRHRPAIGEALARRSLGQPGAITTHAWRAQQRLHRRYRHLVGRGKRAPVAAVAVARELVGFLWAAMTDSPRPRRVA
jgi:transposase